jgi:hypothetical protein
MNSRHYAGVGSRTAPDNILRMMSRIAKQMAQKGIVLRSGGAEGCDLAFERGAGKCKEIFRADDATEESMKMAAEYHPAWSNLSIYARKLHARNCMQILGRDLDKPVECVICWTQDGADGVNKKTTQKTGGTGQAIRIAAGHGIIVYNLFDKSKIIEVAKRYKLVDIQ